MSNRVVTICERALTTTVNDIEHIESSSYSGAAVIRVYFQRTAKVEMAIAQTTALVQTLLRPMPPGIFPPSIIKYDASSVPILQLGISSQSLSEQELYDYGQNFIRTQLATVQGASIPLPWGGKARAVMVDLDPEALFAKRLSATDISNSLNLQNLILPAGTAKIGEREYQVLLNSSPTTIAGMNDLPVRSANGATVYLRDVAQVRDGFQVQTNVVRINGSRSSMLTVLKNGKASTLDIVEEVKNSLPKIMAGLPKALNVKPLFDQSIFVSASIKGVVHEAVMAAGLTGLMILLFLGSWRSTLIVCVSIPLSILTSLIVLSLMGETINVMTLGGLAPAVGILVDDATVTIENIHRNMSLGKRLTRAILDGAEQIAVPTFVSTLSICIVFVPVLLLTGAARFLFTPMAMAVVFAMLTSYLLSRSLVPTLIHYMLPAEASMHQSGEEGAGGSGIIWRTHQAFERWFERMRDGYHSALSWVLHHRAITGTVFGLFCVGSLSLVFIIGSDFFPTVDSGQMRLHVRAPAGTRIEETERLFGQVGEEVRREIPSEELDTVLDNIGLPNGSVNLGFGDVNTSSSSDGDMLISLKPEHKPTEEYARRLRDALRAKFPDVTFYFLAANITNQILNFGIPASIDVQVMGRNAEANWAISQRLMKNIAGVPGAVDVRMRQEIDAPAVGVFVDRTRAGLAGLTQRDVASSLLISLSSSGQVAPNQWLNPVNGVNYQVNVQTPQYRVDSLDDLRRTPITALSGAGASPQLLENLVDIKRMSAPVVINHFNVQPVYDVYSSVDRRDLGGVATDIEKIIASEKNLPPGTTISMRGQVETMRNSFRRLGFGVVFAILLVYLLMVVNFQSWVDPFIILMALPGAFAGILWMLFATQTTLSVPSLMGTIMAIGVATANSILMVTFANDERGGRQGRLRSCAVGGLYPHSAGNHDRRGNDHRHAANGPLARRRR